MNIRIDDHAAELCRIEIEGTIGVPETWQFDEPADRVATYERFREAVARIAAVEAPEVLVTIRSTGGDVNDALLIHDALRQLGARITTRCYGYTASAATVIAQAASEGCRELSANALYLIHRASCATEGNADELGARIGLLQATDERLAALYAARAGRDAASFAALMAENNGNGRWLSPEEAIEAGLADRIADPGGSPQTEARTDAPTGTRPRAAERPAAGWRRLLRAIGLAAPHTDLPPAAPHNILHFDAAHPQQPAPAPTAAARPVTRTLADIEPTRTQPTEDPRYGALCRSANERAYAEDARRFGRN